MTINDFNQFVNNARKELTQAANGKAVTDLEIYAKAIMDFEEFNTQRALKQIESSKNLQDEIAQLIFNNFNNNSLVIQNSKDAILKDNRERFDALMTEIKKIANSLGK